MSAIGRIFIVLNLILACCFLGWAAKAMGSAENYKDQLSEATKAHAEELSDKDDEIARLRTEKSDLEETQRRFREERNQATAAKDSLEGQLADAKRENNTMQGELAKISSTLGDYNDTIAQLTREKDAAVQRAHDAENERDDAKADAQTAELARRDAVEAAKAANVMIADLEKSSESLRKEVSSLETNLSSLVAITGVDPGDVTTVKEIEGSVLETRNDLSPALVMLNVGSESGVKRGTTFHIYRGGQYKGQVRVENVQAKFSSAIVTGLNDGMTIAQGDSAATVL